MPITLLTPSPPSPNLQCTCLFLGRHVHRKLGEGGEGVRGGPWLIFQCKNQDTKFKKRPEFPLISLLEKKKAQLIHFTRFWWCLQCENSFQMKKISWHSKKEENYVFENGYKDLISFKSKIATFHQLMKTSKNSI